MEVWPLLLSGLCTLANVLTHFALNHRERPRAPLRRLITGFLVGLGVLGVSLGMLRARQGAWELETAGLSLGLYLMLSFCYFNFINLNMTSIRIRLLRELLGAGEQGLLRTEVVGRYGAHHVLHVRLERLTQGGEVRHSGDAYVLAGSSVRVIAVIFDILRWLVTGRPYEKPFERA